MADLAYEQGYADGRLEVLRLTDAIAHLCESPQPIWPDQLQRLITDSP